MNRRVLSSMIVFAMLATLSVVCVNCKRDTTAPSIYFLAKDGKTIDKKGDTVVLLYNKYVDPGCYVEDNASDSANITIESNLDAVLPIEKKLASHMGEVKKTGDFEVTYTATDEEGNAGTRSKVISCKNVSDIYNGKYWTVREEVNGSTASVAKDTAYYSTVAAANNVAGRIRFSKVACHIYNGKKVSFKVDADLFSPELSPSTRSDQIGYLGKASDKESVLYEGMSYDQAVDSIRLNYVYLQIPNQEYTAYSEDDATVSEYKVRIKGRMDGQVPRSKIVYDERGGLKYIILDLTLTIDNVVIGNDNNPYIEKYYLE